MSVASEVEHRTGSTQGERNRLIDEHLNLARSLARRFARNADDREELQQVASVALVAAAGRFDPEQGDFARFAFSSIVGEIKRFRRDASWTVRVPRRLQEAFLEVEAARDSLTQELGRVPTPREVSEETGRDLEEVLEALEVGLMQFMSLEDDIDIGGGMGTDRVVDRVALERAMEGLGDADHALLELAYGRGLTQREIGREIGSSQTHVHRQLARIIAGLRERLAVPTDSDPT